MSPQGRQGPDLPYRLLAGVVPCANGWLVASGKLVGATLHADAVEVVAHFRDVLDHVPTYAVVAVGAPIGLYDEAAPGGRLCDREARRLLGWPRLGAISSAPGRRQLAPARRRGPVQPPALARIAELDAEMEPYRQRSVLAVHPELSLWSLNREAPLEHSKHDELGIEERAALVCARVQNSARLLDRHAEFGGGLAAMLDAVAILWTARRIQGHSATRVPEGPEWDRKGLRTEWVV